MKKKIVLPVIAISALLAIGAVSAVSAVSVFKSGTATQVEESLILTKTAAENIQIKKVTSGTDNDGHEYKTYSYSISPNDAYYHEVTASISFADERVNGSSYLTCSIDNTNKTFTVTCLQAFDSVATLRLKASWGTAYADIQIDYKQKVTGVTYINQTDNFNDDPNAITLSTLWVYDLQTIIGNHFEYTKTNTYTIAETREPGFLHFGNNSNSFYMQTIINQLDLDTSSSDKSAFLSLCKNEFSNIDMNAYPRAPAPGGMTTINNSGPNFTNCIENIIDSSESNKYLASNCLDPVLGCWKFSLNLNGLTCEYRDYVGETDVNYTFTSSHVYNFNVYPIQSWNMDASSIQTLSPESGTVVF